MEKVTKNEELEEILNTLKPMESVWCSCLQAEIVMFHTGYSVSLYNSETEQFISSYFVPNKR